MVEPTRTAPEPGEPGQGLARLGPRTQRRAAPRLTIALAAAGCALVVLGALVVGGDNLGGGGDDDGSNLPGIVLSAGVIVAGFMLLQRFRSGPLATAGAVAAAFGVPPLLFFLTFDANSFPPYSTDAILFMSTAAWAIGYLVGPARSRPLFLGAACIGLWATLLQAVEDLFDAPFLLVRSFGVGFQDDGFDSGFAPSAPDPTTIGLLSLGLALAYLLVARRWDRERLVGAATPVTAAALLIIPFGIGALAEDLEATGTGLLTACIGLALAAHGASVGRRATTYLGAVGIVLGLLIVIGELVDEATPGGLVLMAVGAGVVVGAEALRQSSDEPDELADVGEPQTF